MDFERVDSEILSVEQIGSATIKRHFTFYAHVKAAIPIQAAVGTAISIPVELVRWDDAAARITDEDRQLEVLVNGAQATTVQTAAGLASVNLLFNDPGEYQVEIGAVEVVVASGKVVIA